MPSNDPYRAYVETNDNAPTEIRYDRDMVRVCTDYTAGRPSWFTIEQTIQLRDRLDEVIMLHELLGQDPVIAWQRAAAAAAAS